ncbi:putative uncharacterized protein DDB_G0291608 isoform X2 [Musca domestica]|nr:putative uncharacterized protein DDB_G0291608 isoform X2 [Musca domestica]
MQPLNSYSSIVGNSKINSERNFPQQQKSTRKDGFRRPRRQIQFKGGNKLKAIRRRFERIYGGNKLIKELNSREEELEIRRNNNTAKRELEKYSAIENTLKNMGLAISSADDHDEDSDVEIGILTEATEDIGKSNQADDFRDIIDLNSSTEELQETLNSKQSQTNEIIDLNDSLEDVIVLDQHVITVQHSSPDKSFAPQAVNEVYSFIKSLSEAGEFQELLTKSIAVYPASELDKAILSDMQSIENSIYDFAIALHKTYEDLDVLEYEQRKISEKYILPHRLNPMETLEIPKTLDQRHQCLEISKEDEVKDQHRFSTPDKTQEAHQTSKPMEEKQIEVSSNSNPEEHVGTSCDPSSDNPASILTVHRCSVINHTGKCQSDTCHTLNLSGEQRSGDFTSPQDVTESQNANDVNNRISSKHDSLGGSEDSTNQETVPESQSQSEANEERNSKISSKHELYSPRESVVHEIRDSPYLRHVLNLCQGGSAHEALLSSVLLSKENNDALLQDQGTENKLVTSHQLSWAPDLNPSHPNEISNIETGQEAKICEIPGQQGPQPSQGDMLRNSGVIALNTTTKPKCESSRSCQNLEKVLNPKKHMVSKFHNQMKETKTSDALLTSQMHPTPTHTPDFSTAFEKMPREAESPANSKSDFLKNPAHKLDDSLTMQGVPSEGASFSSTPAHPAQRLDNTTVTKEISKDLTSHPNSTPSSDSQMNYAPGFENSMPVKNMPKEARVEFNSKPHRKTRLDVDTISKEFPNFQDTQISTPQFQVSNLEPTDTHNQVYSSCKETATTKKVQNLPDNLMAPKQGYTPKTQSGFEATSTSTQALSNCMETTTTGNTQNLPDNLLAPKQGYNPKTQSGLEPMPTNTQAISNSMETTKTANTRNLPDNLMAPKQVNKAKKRASSLEALLSIQEAKKSAISNIPAKKMKSMSKKKKMQNVGDHQNTANPLRTTPTSRDKNPTSNTRIQHSSTPPRLKEPSMHNFSTNHPCNLPAITTNDPCQNREQRIANSNQKQLEYVPTNYPCYDRTFAHSETPGGRPQQQNYALHSPGASSIRNDLNSERLKGSNSSYSVPPSVGHPQQQQQNKQQSIPTAIGSAIQNDQSHNQPMTVSPTHHVIPVGLHQSQHRPPSKSQPQISHSAVPNLHSPHFQHPSRKTHSEHIPPTSHLPLSNQPGVYHQHLRRSPASNTSVGPPDFLHPLPREAFTSYPLASTPNQHIPHGNPTYPIQCGPYNPNHPTPTPHHITYNSSIPTFPAEQMHSELPFPPYPQHFEIPPPPDPQLCAQLPGHSFPPYPCGYDMKAPPPPNCNQIQQQIQLRDQLPAHVINCRPPSTSYNRNYSPAFELPPPPIFNHHLPPGPLPPPPFITSHSPLLTPPQSTEQPTSTFFPPPPAPAPAPIQYNMAYCGPNSMMAIPMTPPSENDIPIQNPISFPHNNTLLDAFPPPHQIHSPQSWPHHFHAPHMYQQ